MSLKEELNVLKCYYESNDVEKFQEQTDLIYSKYTSPSEVSAIFDFTKELISGLTERTDNFVKETTVRVQLAEQLQVLPLSYIAEKYFKRSRQWLYQKINGNLKNGKQASFTSAEKDTFNKAIQEISNDIGSLRIV